MMARRLRAETPCWASWEATQKGVDTMTRNLDKKLADAKEMATKVAKLDRTAQIFILGDITARLLCKQNGNKTA